MPARGGKLPSRPPAACRKTKSKERGEAQAAARQDATLVLMKELPTLLKKLQTDPAQVGNRVLLPLHKVAIAANVS